MAATELCYDPRLRAVIDNPFPLFERLQREAPVHWSEPLRGWVVTRYDDCKAVLLDRRFSAERMRPFFANLPTSQRSQLQHLEASVSLWTVFLDPPDHTRLRRLLNRGFTSRAVNGMAPRIAEIVHAVIDEVSDRDQIDFIRDLAYRVPATVIVEMLGAPRTEIEHFKRWSDDLSLFVGSSRITPDKYARAEAAAAQMTAAFRELVRERRRRPRADMISDLIRAEDAGEVLNEDELIATCVLLLFAGHETTGNLLGTGMYYLIRNPEQLAILRRHPELAEPAVEEILRIDGPNAAVTRIAAETLDFRGHRIAVGQRVFAMINAANRDPEVFADPHRFDIRRAPPAGAPLGQLAFGHGIHFCIGAPLARLEGRIALPIFAERLRDAALVGAEPSWLDSLSFRGLSALPLRCRWVGRRT